MIGQDSSQVPLWELILSFACTFFLKACLQDLLWARTKNWRSDQYVEWMYFFQWREHWKLRWVTDRPSKILAGHKLHSWSGECTCTCWQRGNKLLVVGVRWRPWLLCPLLDIGVRACNPCLHSWHCWCYWLRSGNTSLLFWTWTQQKSSAWVVFLWLQSSICFLFKWHRMLAVLWCPRRILSIFSKLGKCTWCPIPWAETSKLCCLCSESFVWLRSGCKSVLQKPCILEISLKTSISHRGLVRPYFHGAASKERELSQSGQRL